MIEAQVLGPLVLRSDGVELKPTAKKGRGLIAYLACAGIPIERNRLADLLWPYQGPDQSRHSLRNCLLELRKELRPEDLQPTFTEVGANSRCDLTRFRELAESRLEHELCEAADLYRGEFMADFDINSDVFGQWLAEMRETTQRQACEVLARLVSLYSDGGAHGQAIFYGRRLDQVDRCWEVGQRILMVAYAAAGRRSDAIRQYKLCVAALRQHLDVTPDAETVALARSLARPESSVAAKLPSEPEIEALPFPGGGTPCRVTTIGVAPLRSLGGGDTRWLGAAMTADLLSDLMSGPSWRVVPLDDAAAAARRGDVDYVITGSLQPAADKQVRINFQITRSSPNEIAWAGRHVGDVESIAAVQLRLTARVAREMRWIVVRELGGRLASQQGIGERLAADLRTLEMSPRDPLLLASVTAALSGHTEPLASDFLRNAEALLPSPRAAMVPPPFAEGTMEQAAAA